MASEDMATKLAHFLLSQHVRPHPLTSKSRAELLMGRGLHTAVDRLHPNLQGMVEKQERLAQWGNRNVLGVLSGRCPVFIRNY